MVILNLALSFFRPLFCMYIIKLNEDERKIISARIKIKQILNAGKRDDDFHWLRLNSESVKNASSFDITKQKVGIIL